MNITDIISQRQDSLRLKDGRSLAWYEWGPAHGQPVLFCTGAGMSGSLTFGVSESARQNLRFIAVDRPGLGKSDFHPQKTLTTWTHDISELLQSLKIHRPLCVGFSQGAPFAFALADAGLVSKLAVVSGQDDFAKPSVMSQLPSQISEFVRAIQSQDPSFMEDFTRQADAEGLFHLISSMSSVKDLALYNQEPFRSAYFKSLQEGFAKGSKGYVQDLVSTYRPWPFEIEDLKIPVDIWYGALDQSPVHSPDFGKQLSSRLADSKWHYLEAEGGSLLWTKSQEILESLALP